MPNPDSPSSIHGQLIRLMGPAYRLASHAVQFRWRAEIDYLAVEDRYEPNWSSRPTVLEPLLGVMRYCADQLDNSLSEMGKGAIRDLLVEAQNRMQAMEEQWEGPVRTELLRRLLHRSPDNEFLPSIHHDGILKGIVAPEHWATFEAKLDTVTQSIGPPLHDAFSLARLLCSVPYASHDKYSGDKGWQYSDANYLIGTLGTKARRYRESISKFAPVLDDLPQIIDGNAAPFSLVCELHEAVQSRLDKLACHTTPMEPVVETAITPIPMTANLRREEVKVPMGSAAEKTISPIEIPDDLKWDEVAIHFTSLQSITVAFREFKKEYTFYQLGFADGRRLSAANRSWHYLHYLAVRQQRESGSMGRRQEQAPWRNPAAAGKQLRKLLRAILPIADKDPFEITKSGQAYQHPKFKLTTDMAYDMVGPDEGA